MGRKKTQNKFTMRMQKKLVVLFIFVLLALPDYPTGFL